MKNILSLTLLVSALLLGSCSNTQTTISGKDRIIEVSGIAEKEVTPDEVYFNITLQEYKKSGKKITLSEMEKSLVERAIALGIKKEDLNLENLNAYSYYYYYYGYGYTKKREDILASATYRVKLKDPSLMDKLLEKNEIANITYVNLSHFACSQKEKYLDDLRIKALQATKEKASKLLAVAGAEMGEVITITDLGSQNNGGGYYPYGYYYGGAEERSIANSVDASSGANQQNISPRNIKLRTELKVVYRIK